MKKIDKLLVCIDLSEYSQPTLESAVTVAGNSGAEIHIINVLNRRDVDAAHMIAPFYDTKIDPKKYVTDTTERRRKEIETMIADHFSDVQLPIKIHMKMGTPFEKILQTAEKEEVDLIVMGSKGRSNIASTLFGSQAEKVFRHSKIPVFSIRSKFHDRQ